MMYAFVNAKSLALALAVGGILALSGSEAKAQSAWGGGSPQRGFSGGSKNFFPGGGFPGGGYPGGWGQHCNPYPYPRPYPYPGRFPQPFPYPGGGYPSGGWGGGFPSGGWGGYGGFPGVKR